jgi:hypothetical protein
MSGVEVSPYVYGLPETVEVGSGSEVVHAHAFIPANTDYSYEFDDFQLAAGGKLSDIAIKDVSIDGGSIRWLAAGRWFVVRRKAKMGSRVEFRLSNIGPERVFVRMALMGQAILRKIPK